MTMEAGVLIGLDKEPIYWHLPEDRSFAFLPDSRKLWDIIWENRKNTLGFAHSHPGDGIPGPSYEDITTFAAVEAALGKRLIWWITSSDSLVHVIWIGPAKYRYNTYHNKYYKPVWLQRLREESKYVRAQEEVQHA